MSVRRSDVLRYWLGAIRHEEALGLKIRAAPPDGESAPARVDLLRPRGGQVYFKLRCGGPDGAEDLLFRGVESKSLPIAGDRAAFFEHWLQAHYRAGRRRGPTDADSEAQAGMPMVLGFPVLHDARRGELHTLFQLPGVSVRWRADDGGEWLAPARPGKSTRQPPAQLELQLPVDDEDEGGPRVPYALNELVLSRKLGVPEERIEALGRELATSTQAISPASMVRAVLSLLDSAPTGDDARRKDAPVEGLTADQVGDQVGDQAGGALALIEAVTAAVRRRIVDNRLQVFPIGLAYDGASTYATHYLQLDLRALASGEIAMPAKNPCAAYLDRRAPQPGRRVLLGRRDQPLTATQRAAGEQFLGSRLTVVQGPPGTGKTELITSLCAHTVVERAVALERNDADSSTGPLLVVTSTNNRAVDNVLELLDGPSREHALPLALRVGSRAVVQETTVAILARAQQWLTRATPSQEAWSRAHARARTAVDAVATAEKPVRDALDARATADAARAELIELEQRLAEALRRPPGEQVAPRDLDSARRELRRARSQVTKESKKLAPAHVRLLTADRAFGRLRKLFEGKLAPALAPLGIAAVFPEPPAPDDGLEAWRDALEDVGDALDEVENRVDELGERARAHDDPATLRALMAAATARLERSSELLGATDAHHDALRAAIAANEAGLFEVALELREQWAAHHKQRLLGSLADAIAALTATPSLRALERSKRRAYEDVRRLFPVWGCTLLSMGNNFSTQPGQIARVVIDEAGQCHPAHAVSALFRARQAMVIGDVHQLEPVINLPEREELRVLRRLSLAGQRNALEPYRVYDDARISAQSLAARAVPSVPSLRDHFRCQPEIIDVSNRLCGYELVVETPPASLAQVSPILRGPVLGLRADGAQVSHLGSWRNDDEVALALSLTRALLDDGVRIEQLGVLTPYYGQMQALRDAFAAARLPVDIGDATTHGGADGVALGTLHRFQGGARDVIVLSTVVTSARSLTFTNGRANLINVGVSRARQHLVVVGDMELLAQGPVTGELVRAIPDDAYLDATELMG